ncbi:MAG: substrate-binding domain-containing protein [Chloroflexota bacterium]|nr:substrate-binding domain-containing protein [Chloroflexota bacterium]
MLSAVDKLNYRPDMLARSLRTRSTSTIGLIINDIRNPFYSAVVEGVEDTAIAAGYTVMLCSIREDPAREVEYLQLLRDKGADGIIFAPTRHSRAEIHALLHANVPLVQFDRQLPELPASAVVMNNEQSAYQLVGHLIERGHTDIALATYSLGQLSILERERGYRRALDEAGIASREENICRAGLGQDEVAQLLRELLARAAPPTALVAANNRIGVAALKVIKELDLSVPHDIAVAAFDDIELFSLHDPPITAVAQNAYQIGQRAAELLLAKVRSPQAPSEVITIDAELIVRESTSRCSRPRPEEITASGGSF